MSGSFEGDEIVEIKKSKLEDLIERKVEEKINEKPVSKEHKKPTSETRKGLNRREFLKKSAMGIGGLAALTLPGKALEIRDEEFSVLTGDSTSQTEYFSVSQNGPVNITDTNLDMNNNSLVDVDEINGQDADDIGTSNLTEVLDEGNTAFQNINMNGNSLVDVDEINGQDADKLGPDVAPVQSVNGDDGDVETIAITSTDSGSDSEYDEDDDFAEAEASVTLSASAIVEYSASFDAEQEEWAGSRDDTEANVELSVGGTTVDSDSDSGGSVSSASISGTWPSTEAAEGDTAKIVAEGWSDHGSSGYGTADAEVSITAINVETT